MKVLAIEHADDNAVYGFAEIGENYVQFTAKPGQTAKITYTQAKSEFRDYDHYVGVYGKFNPETMFLAEPIEIEELAYNDLKALWDKPDFPKGW